MEEIAFLFIIGMCYLAYWIGVFLYRVVRWLTSPILEKIEHRRILEEERRKEVRLLEAHERAREAIDLAVAHYVGLHKQAVTESDRQPGRRQSG